MSTNLLSVVSNKSIDRIIGVLIVLGVFVFALIPQQSRILLSYEDKIGHAGLYFLLMIYFSRRLTVLTSAVALFCIGVIIELVQFQVGYRAAEVMDVVANCFGLLLGYIYLKLRGPVNVDT